MNLLNNVVLKIYINENDAIFQAYLKDMKERDVKEFIEKVLRLCEEDTKERTKK